MVDGCGGACACRSGAPSPATGALHLSSGNSHTFALLRRTAIGLGGGEVSEDGLLVVEAGAVAAFLAAAGRVLTPPESAEVRAFFASGGASVADAIAAQTLATLSARVEHARVLGLLDAEAAFYSRYQPIVDLGTGATVAHEALLRAELDGEEVQPAQLFAAAEAANLLHVLDRIGRETAIRGAAGWLGDTTLFVNFVPTSIYRPEVCLKTTERVIEESGVAREHVVFEVTESQRVRETDHLLSILAHYRRNGYRVALDDVGAGYSSLQLLAALEPDVVKIDRELVQGLPTASAIAVVRAIVTMSHDLGALVVGEGIETADQAEAAGELGVDLGQGWHFGRPQRRAPAVRVLSAAPG